MLFKAITNSLFDLSWTCKSLEIFINQHIMFITWLLGCHSWSSCKLSSTKRMSKKRYFFFWESYKSKTLLKYCSKEWLCTVIITMFAFYYISQSVFFKHIFLLPHEASVCFWKHYYSGYQLQIWLLLENCICFSYFKYFVVEMLNIHSFAIRWSYQCLINVNTP